MQTDMLLQMLAQNQMTCGAAFHQITAENATTRLNAAAASAGFIYRHVGETMHLFGFFFGLPTWVQNTTMGYLDTGQGQNLEESRLLIEEGYAQLQALVKNTPEPSWLEPVDTPFFGTVSRVRLFSHILFHNAHHAGQIALTLSKAEKVVRQATH